MPELPEVETIKKTLQQLVIGKTIERVDVRLNRIVRRPEEPAYFEALMQGQTFLDVERRGKFLRFVFDDLVLVSHLRMEGKYGLFSSDEPVAKHTHVIFHLTNGEQFRYNDVRQFGTMDLFEKGKEWDAAPLNKLGIEPMEADFTLDRFRQLLGSRKTKIKSFLLNQAYIVGIGNIYADEVLFIAGVHPERPIHTLTIKEQTKLHVAILTILSKAIEVGGSTIKSYVNGQGEMGMFQQQLQVYGRKDEECTQCGTPIERLVVAGRGTHVCFNCQPLT